MEKATDVFLSVILASGREESLKAAGSGGYGDGGGRVRLQCKKRGWARGRPQESAPSWSARWLHQTQEGLTACPKAPSTDHTHPSPTLALRGPKEIQEALPLPTGAIWVV